MSVNESLYATCASGLQHLLATELTDLGAKSVSTAGAGVRFSGGMDVAYKACLWSRVANRVLLPIHSGPVSSPEELYLLVKEIDWSQHMSLRGTLAVDFFTANSTITHSQYGALKVKDAVVDQFRESSGERPNVERDTPDLRINVYLFRNKARVAIDLSGSSLHRRGYREQAGPAPVKENLAAALLMQCNWAERAQRAEPFMDPLCGSGTLVIEAAMIACKIAPGLTRKHYGFTGWLGHDNALWETILSDAKQQVRGAPCDIRGADKDGKAITLAQENAAIAGVDNEVGFERGDVLTQRFNAASVKGIVVSNPPYGQRLEADSSFYKQLGSALSGAYAGWHCGLFTAIEAPLKHAHLPLRTSLTARNGSIDCALYEGDIPGVSARTAARLDDNSASSHSPDTNNSSNVWDNASSKRQSDQSAGIRKLGESTSSQHEQGTARASKRSEPTVDATPFANRIKKNIKRLKAWKKREGISAYRVYDADLPEFSVAIDIYDCEQRYVVVQEYQAPSSVNVLMAEARLKAVLSVVPELLQVDKACMHLKVREKQSGLAQYEKQSASKMTGLVQEFGYKLECNFSDYLDTGVFLDHRKVREYIHQNSSAKRFLNLFSYTGSATIAAATGGASGTVSVDLSNRYSQWLSRNLAHNRLNDVTNQVVKSDVIKWLDENSGERFDLILLDPPTFSNSTGIDADWNVQRDHVECIRQCMKLLNPAGVLVFSNNYRRFKLDESLGVIQAGKKTKRTGSADSNAVKPSNDLSNSRKGLMQYSIEDRTHWSIDQDFQRNARIHQCWFLSHLG